MEAGTKDPGTLGSGELSKGPGEAAVDKAAAGKQLDAHEASAATAWFLEEEQPEVNQHTFELNVGVGTDEHGEPNERWVSWTVAAIDRDRIRSIRRSSVRRRGRGPLGAEEDDMLANLRIASEGTVDPDLRDPKVRGKYADPAAALEARFSFKPGLVDQIASRVLQASGYDEDDVREVDAAKG